MLPYAGVDTSRLLVEAMKVAEANHRIIANNVANADTPHFTPTRLDFQATLRSAVEGSGRISLRKTQPRHLDVSRDRPAFDRLAVLSKNDYNKVDVDQEMALLSENTGRYTVYASLLVKHFEQMKHMLNDLR